jgi:hypothetical protein
MDSETRSQITLALLWVMISVVCLFMSLRFYCEGECGERLGELKIFMYHAHANNE